MSRCGCNASLVINGSNNANLAIRDNDPMSVCLNTKDRGPAGKDATINGVNTLELTTSGNVVLTQIGNVANITTTTFVFEQGVASDTWIVNHGLNKNPSVSVVDSAGNEVIAEVTYDDSNNLTIRTRGAFKGKAFLN